MTSLPYVIIIMMNCNKEKFQLWSGMKVIVPSKSVPNQKWRCDPMRSDKSHLLIIKEEKNQVVIIKISQGMHSQLVFYKTVWGIPVCGSVIEWNKSNSGKSANLISRKLRYIIIWSSDVAREQFEFLYYLWYTSPFLYWLRYFPFTSSNHKTISRSVVANCWTSQNHVFNFACSRIFMGDSNSRLRYFLEMSWKCYFIGW